MRTLLAASLLVAFTARASSIAAEDPLASYDVLTYRLDLRVDPATETLSGTVAVEARVTAETLDALQLDLKPTFAVATVVELAGAVEPRSALSGAPLAFAHEKALLTCKLGAQKKKGDVVRVAIAYSGKPVARDKFAGFHWSKTSDGKPWICTSCQDEGSASWWPGKDSFFHPEDKPERVFENYRVPQGLYAVGNGRLVGREPGADGTETFHWVHEYPLETYSVTLDVAPYVVVERELALLEPDAAGSAETPKEGEKLPFLYYVLPEHADKAALQFQDVPGMLAAYTRAFGPFPFPKSKYALVETCFWGMEHSTAVAYGSSFPKWIAEHGGRDPYASRNTQFDYILVHESAHEWWGNGVSARTWGDFWIHEGFATYAEAVYLESVKGPEAAQKHLDTWKRSIGKKSRLFRGENLDSEQAYDQVLYSKGAWVLHTLRYCVDDDAQWWRALAAFNRAYRYGNAGSEDFRGVLEKVTGKEWNTFFDEWVYGQGYPEIQGTVHRSERSIAVDVTVKGTAETGFHVPLEIAWKEASTAKKMRIALVPGSNRVEIPCSAGPEAVSVSGLERVLGKHSVVVD